MRRITANTGSGLSLTCEADMAKMLKNELFVTDKAEQSIVIDVQGIIRRGLDKKVAHSEIQKRVTAYVNRAISYQSDVSAQIAELEAKLADANAKLASYENK